MYHSNTIMNQSFVANAPYPYYAPAPAYYYPMAQYPVEQLSQQQAQAPVDATIRPTENDVLMGRGGKNNMHIGNEKLRQMARSMISKYQAADKKEKSNMSLALVDKVHSLSPAGRFLKRNSTTMEWHIVSDELAREKTSQCLRDAVSVAKKRCSTSSSSAAKTPNQEPLKRKVTPTLLDMEVVTSSNKRRRVEPTKNEDDATVFTISADVIADLLENRPTENIFDEVATIISDDATFQQEPSFEFELFDCNSLLDEQDLLCEPIAEIFD